MTDIIKTELLPDFNENAQQLLWDPDSLNIDSNDRSVIRNASIISDLLEVKNPAEQREAIKYLEGILSAQPRTFHAIKNIAMEGISFAELKTIIELRHAWAERSDWWVYRRKGEVYRSQGALSWELAQQICQARSEFPIDQMIEESWLEEWLCLRPGTAGYQSFSSFIEEKIKHKDAEFLYDGLLTEMRKA